MSRTHSTGRNARRDTGYINTLVYRIPGLGEYTTYSFFVYAGDAGGYDVSGVRVNSTTKIARTSALAHTQTSEQPRR